jgi:hypothetical protein
VTPTPTVTPTPSVTSTPSDTFMPYIRSDVLPTATPTTTGAG